MHTAAKAATTGRRITDLDALRGFALCGILIVNIYQQLVGRSVSPDEFSAVLDSAPTLIQFLFVERFFPIFSVLFGIGFGIFLQRASKRTSRPRLVLARRLAVLLAIGLVHFIFHYGEVLSMYAVFGLLVLLPLSYLGGRAALAIATILLLLGAAVMGGPALIPGLLAAGYALAALGAHHALEERMGRVGVAFAVSAAAAICLYLPSAAQLVFPSPFLARLVGNGLAVSMGMVYACGFLLLLHGPLRRPLTFFFSPMGRMALTNYLSATALFLTIGPLLGIDGFDDLSQIVLLTIGINLLQAGWSMLWLRRQPYGPAEWVWRRLAWGRLNSPASV